MPFSTTDVKPRSDAKVTVTFAGLMLLRPAPDNTLEVGIHRFTRTHLFQVMLVVNKPNQPPRLIRLLTGPLTSDFEMIVDPAPATGIQGFAPKSNFDRNDAENDPLDYRWAVNLRSYDGHAQVDFNDGAKPIVKLNAGVLYTPNLTRPDLNMVLVSATAEEPVKAVAADLAAAIELPEGTMLRLKWSEMGDPQTEDLPRQGDPEGTTYTVALLNDPPLSTPAAHDELELYYKVLETPEGEIEQERRHRLEVLTPHKTDEIPCLPVILEP